MSKRDIMPIVEAFFKLAHSKSDIIKISKQLREQVKYGSLNELSTNNPMRDAAKVVFTTADWFHDEYIDRALYEALKLWEYAASNKYKM